MENENVHRITLGGREIILIGTAHVSRESADLVERVIAEERPDTVCVELCRPRYEAIQQRDKWQQTDIVKVIREKRTSILLSQLIMASLQRKIAEKFNITPGEEMLRAIARAEEIGAEIVLADREIRVTLLRTWRKMGFWSKMKVLPDVLMSLFATDEITEEEIEKLKQHDVLELALQTDRRETAGAQDHPDRRAGSLHGPHHRPCAGQPDRGGRRRRARARHPRSTWARRSTLRPSTAFPRRESGADLPAGSFPWPSWVSSSPASSYSGSQASLKMIAWWSLITAAFSGFGALILLAHPLTIAASALAAPITTLHPLIAAGWVAGLVEATLRKPQVKDFLALKDDIISIRGFFRNKITRLLLLVAVVNLTTSIGTFVAIPVIMRFL